MCVWGGGGLQGQLFFLFFLGGSFSFGSGGFPCSQDQDGVRKERDKMVGYRESGK